LIEVIKVQSLFRTKLDLVHLPFQDAAAGNFGRGNALTLNPRVLEIPQKALSNFWSQCKSRVGISQNLSELLLDHLADKRFQLLD